MGQSAGAKQEQQQLQANKAQQSSDIANRDAAIGTYTGYVSGMTPSIQQTQADVNALQPSIDQSQQDVNAQAEQAQTAKGAVDTFATTPGYTPGEIASMKANVAGQIHGQYGDEMEQLRRNASNQGGNSSGLPSQLAKATQERALSTAMGANNVDTQAANEAASGRRLVPGMYSTVVGDYGQVANNQGAVTGQLSNKATQQGAVTGQQGAQAGLSYAPVNTLTGESENLTGAETGLIGQMPKTNPWMDILKQGLASAGQVGAAVKGGG